MYVYILYHYEEHGAQDVMATTDRRDLPVMLAKYQKTGAAANDDEIKALTALLRRPEEELAHGWEEHSFPNAPLQRVYDDGRHDLAEGWGGWVLQVTELYKSKTVKFA